MTAAIYLPQIMRIGAGASAKLPEVLTQLSVAKPLLVTDAFMRDSGYVAAVVSNLSAAGVSCGVFADCVPDPTTDSIAAGMASWHSGDYDCVVALGGGSSIDSAKAIAVLALHGGTMRDYKVPNPVPRGVPIIAIPTTAGTGSEATRATIITDGDSQEKMLCMGYGLMPVAAIVDYELTLSMPYRLTADTGIDSLCHAMEAYVSKKANPFTDSVALAAMTAITSNIRQACNEPDNRVVREAMMLAATWGGMAFSNASVTLIHGMSRPIGAFYHVPHGMSNAMLMPAVTEFSLPGAPKRYADCARAMGFASGSDSDTTAGAALVVGLYQLNEDLSVPSPAAFGIDQEHYFASLGTMAEQALASGSPNNNPKIPTALEIEQLYRAVWT
ncbi:MAG: alcohol dehydrogenase class IV [Paraglaciecola psychrophila]|jgi:alcohol dehydrogenase class IV